MLKNIRWISIGLKTYSAFMLVFVLISFNWIFQTVKQKEFFVVHDSTKVIHFLDFLYYYGSGVIARTMPSSSNYYADGLLRNVIQSICVPYTLTDPVKLEYPPNFFLICKPLAALALPEAWMVWVIVSIVLLLASAFILWRQNRSDGAVILFGLCGYFCAFPTWVTVREGQMALYIIPFWLVFCMLLRNKKYLLAGISLPILCVKVQFIPVFVIMGSLGGWRFFRGFAIGLALIAILTAAIVGVNNILDWPNSLIQWELSPHTGAATRDLVFENLRGLLITYCGGNSIVNQGISALTYLGSLAYIVILCIQTRNALKRGDQSRTELDFFFAQASLCMIVFAPHIHTPDYTLPLVAFYFLWKYCNSIDQTPAVKALKLLMIAYPIMSWSALIIQLMVRRIQFCYVTLIVLLAAYTFFQYRRNSGHKHSPEQQTS